MDDLGGKISRKSRARRFISAALPSFPLAVPTRVRAGFRSRRSAQVEQHRVAGLRGGSEKRDKLGVVA